MASIRSRSIVVLISIALAVAAVLIMFVERQFVDVLDELDDARLDEAADALAFSIEAEVHRLDALAVDWGSWTETYDHVAGRAPEYVAENFAGGTLVSLTVDAVAIMDLDHEPVAAHADLGDGLVAPPDHFLDFARTRSLDGIEEPGSTRVGYTRIGESVWLVAETGVTDSWQTLAPNGLLIWGVEVDDEVLAGWARSTGGSIPRFFRERPATAVDPPEDLLTSSVALPSLSTDEVELWFDRDREARQVGRATSQGLLHGLVLLSTLATALAVFWLDRRVLRRVKRLAQEVDAADLGTRASVTVEGDDELAAVATSVNDLLAREGAARAQLDAHNAELIEAGQVKDTFLSMVSHELRTPLTAILGLTQTLQTHQESLDPDTHRDFVRRIENQARTLNGLVGDLLTVQRNGRHDRVSESCSIDDSLASVVRDLPEEIHTSTTLRLHAPDLAVGIGHEELRRVISNLLVNAHRYGAAPFIVESHPGETSVTVIVADHGQGVDQAFRDQLFQPFTQASRGDRRESKGFGLGLSIVSSIVDGVGGTIHHRPAPWGGALFEINLPVAGGSGDETLEDDEPQAEARALTGR